MNNNEPLTQKNRSYVALAVIAALVLGGCSGSSGAASDPTGPAPERATATSAPTLEAGSAEAEAAMLEWWSEADRSAGRLVDIFVDIEYHLDFNQWGSLADRCQDLRHEVTVLVSSVGLPPVEAHEYHWGEMVVAFDQAAVSCIDYSRYRLEGDYFDFVDWIDRGTVALERFVGTTDQHYGDNWRGHES